MNRIGSELAFAALSHRVLTTSRRRIGSLIDECQEPLPSALRAVLSSYLGRGIERDPPRNIVLAIAFDLDVRDIEKLTDISSATALGGMHSLLLDDIVDNKESASQPWTSIYLAHVLYVLHQDLLQTIHPSDWVTHGRPETLSAQLETYSALVEEELNHVGRSNTYTDVSIVWRKCAPVKAVIERVLALTGNYDSRSDLYEASDLACFALCTLDDMLDWPQDLSKGRYTFPIQLALDRLAWKPAEHSEAETRAAIQRELVFGVIHHELMGIVVNSLEKAHELVSPISPSLAEFLTASLSSAEASWHRHIQYLMDVDQSLSERVESV